MTFLLGDCLELVACKLPGVTWPFNCCYYLSLLYLEGNFMVIVPQPSISETGRAILSSLVYQRSSALCDFNFYFYMNGNPLNSLNVYLKTAGSSSLKVCQFLKNEYFLSPLLGAIDQKSHNYYTSPLFTSTFKGTGHINYLKYILA